MRLKKSRREKFYHFTKADSARLHKLVFFLESRSEGGWNQARFFLRNFLFRNKKNQKNS